MDDSSLFTCLCRCYCPKPLTLSSIVNSRQNASQVASQTIPSAFPLETSHSFLLLYREWVAPTMFVCCLQGQGCIRTLRLFFTVYSEKRTSRSRGDLHWMLLKEIIYPTLKSQIKPLNFEHSVVFGFLKGGLEDRTLSLHFTLFKESGHSCLLCSGWALCLNFKPIPFIFCLVARKPSWGNQSLWTVSWCGTAAVLQWRQSGWNRSREQTTNCLFKFCWGGKISMG